jgi:hypothetical protein
VLALQYTAAKFLPSGDQLLRATPTRLASQAFLDCYALLHLVGGLLVLIWFVVAAVRIEDLSFAWLGVALFALLEYLGCVALHPGLLNITVAEGAAAEEEAVGILAFLVKALLRVVPVCFGVWATVGAAALAVAVVNVLRDEYRESMTLFTLAGSNWVVGPALLPFAAFVVFLLSYLAVALVRAVLSVPAKLDALRGTRP